MDILSTWTMKLPWSKAIDHALDVSQKRGRGYSISKMKMLNGNLLQKVWRTRRMKDARRSAHGASCANVLERSQTMYIAHVQCVSRSTRKIFGVTIMTRYQNQEAAPKNHGICIIKDLESAQPDEEVKP